MANHLINLSGERFGKLVVLERDFSKNEHGQHGTFWKCRCDCGNYPVVSASHLKTGNAKSCGCANKVGDLTGKRFGRWIVLAKAKNQTKSRGYAWLCKCDCGNEKIVLQCSLLNGRSVSCGCYHKEEIKTRQRTHGMSKSRLYSIYHGLLNRCLNKNDKRYCDYGERGISICNEWLTFEPFMNWSLSHGYSDSLSIDRIDNNKGYSPENCRWATVEEQSNNKQRTIYFEFLGVKKSLRQWINYMGWNYKKYYARYHRQKETFHPDEVREIEAKLLKEQSNGL